MCDVDDEAPRNALLLGWTVGVQHKSKMIKGVTVGAANALQRRRIERLRGVCLIPTIVESDGPSGIASTQRTGRPR